MKNINIQISDTLHKELKLIATEEEKTLKTVIINALETYVNGKKDKKRRQA
jgi:predicted HicB family RNase H-like nuclease